VKLKFAITASVVCLLALAVGCSKSTPPGDRETKRIAVVATIFPIADAVRQIGGEDVEVYCLLPAGQSPHDFEPKAEHAEKIASADLLVMIGMGIDEWASPAATAAGSKDIAILRLTEDAAFLKDFEPAGEEADHEDREPDEAEHRHDEADGHEQGHHQEHGDPHVWLDPVYMQDFAAAIAAKLIEIDPLHAKEYATRRDAFLAELRRLDEDYRSELAAVPNKNFVTFHAAFTYIARRYGLHQESIYLSDAAGFGPGQIERVANFVRANNVRAIFAEPQFPPEMLDTLARQSGAKVASLDPQGNPTVEGYDSYIAMMRSNLRSLVSALK